MLEEHVSGGSFAWTLIDVLVVLQFKEALNTLLLIQILIVRQWWRLAVKCRLVGRASNFGALDRLLLVVRAHSHAVIVADVLLLKLIENRSLLWLRKSRILGIVLLKLLGFEVRLEIGEIVDHLNARELVEERLHLFELGLRQ